MVYFLFNKIMQITPIPCLTDNYAYIIKDTNSKMIGVVDPSEALPIISFLNKKKLYLISFPYDILYNRTEYKWFLNLSEKQFLQSKLQARVLLNK